MFYTLLYWDAWQKILLKTLFVSIPEEFFLVMFTLILVGEFEYWKEPECKCLINRFDYVRVFLPTIITALLSEILRYMDLKSTFFQLIPFILFYIIIVFTNDIFRDASALKWMAKTFMYLLLGFLIIGLSEFIYMPFILFSADLTLIQISSNVSLYFILSIPSRLLQYSILLYLISMRRTLLKGRLLKPILSNPVLTVIFSILVAFNILFLQVMAKYISYEEVLINLSHFSRIIIIIILVVIFPILNISALVWSSYYIKNYETIDKKNANEKLNILLKEIQLYTNNDNYDNIRWKLNEIGMGIEEVAASLYKEDETDKH